MRAMIERHADGALDFATLSCSSAPARRTTAPGGM